jgi:REP element-mobilizing transposase RayT
VRPGAWYHITARGIERRPIFHDDRDRSHFCKLLAELADRFKVVVHGYVLMSNHYHLLLETPLPNLSQAMQWLNVSYTVWFNRRRQRVGPLLQGRFKAIVFDPSESALRLSVYVHLNPVRLKALAQDKATRKAQAAGLSQKPDPAVVRQRLERLRNYRWSSYLAYAGYRAAPEWLERETILGYLGKGAGDRHQAYRQYVEQSIREGLRESLWDTLVEQAILGSQKFIESLRRQWRGNERESPGLKRLRGMPGWKDAVQVVERLKGQRWKDFRDQHGDWGRDLALYLGRKRCGLNLRTLGELAGGIDYVSVSGAVRRLEKRAEKGKFFKKLLHNAITQIENK